MCKSSVTITLSHLAACLGPRRSDHLLSLHPWTANSLGASNFPISFPGGIQAKVSRRGHAVCLSTMGSETIAKAGSAAAEDSRSQNLVGHFSLAPHPTPRQICPLWTDNWLVLFIHLVDRFQVLSLILSYQEPQVPVGGRLLGTTVPGDRAVDW